MEKSNATPRPDRIRYTRQSITTNTFLQMPRFLMAGEFAGDKLSNNCRMLYTLLHDRHRISVKNGWFDENGEVYIYFKREEMSAQLGISENTVLKAMKDLAKFFLVEEKKQGLNRPNRIYLLSPVVGNDDNPDPYLDPVPDYSPNIHNNIEEDNYIYEHATSAAMDTQNLRSPTLNNCGSKPAKNNTLGGSNSACPNPQILHPNNNKLNNNELNDNYMSNNEGSDTAAADGGINSGTDVAAATTNPPTPHSQILKMYNQLCETKGLRPIRSINGNRKTQTAARFKEYGLSGFFDLFCKVSASDFLCGGGERGWKADFDWLIAPTNMQKVLEGKYDNEQYNIPAPQIQIADTYSAHGYSDSQHHRPLRNPQKYNSPKNNNERHDPFLERAIMAYETAKSTAV